MAESVAAVCGPAEAAGYRRYVEFVSELYRLEMRSFIDRNIDSPLSLVRPSLARLAALGGFRRLAPKVAQFLQGRADAAGVLVPGHVRRAVAVRRPRDLRRDRLHGLGGRRVLPARRHARRAAGAGRRGGEARRRAAVRRDGDARRAARRPRGGGAHGVRRAGRLRRRGAQPGPAGGASADRGAGAAEADATRRPASCCWPARPLATPTRRTTRSRSAPHGGRCSTRSSAAG